MSVEPKGAKTIQHNLLKAWEEEGWWEAVPLSAQAQRDGSVWREVALRGKAVQLHKCLNGSVEGCEEVVMVDERVK